MEGLLGWIKRKDQVRALLLDWQQGLKVDYRLDWKDYELRLVYN